MTAQPTPLYCNAFRTLKRRAANGHELTIREIEDAIDADPPTQRAIAEIADEVRAGRDFTLAEVAARARMPADFLAMCILALMGHFAIGLNNEAAH